MNDELDGNDVRRLRVALSRAKSVRLYRRVQAVLLVAQGRSVSEVARIVGTSPASIYGWVKRYRATRCIDSLTDAPRSGRPSTTRDLPDAVIEATLRSDPTTFGYATTGWTVALLVQHLSREHQVTISACTLRRRLHALGWRWKRPRYVLAERDPHQSQKKGGLYAV